MNVENDLGHVANQILEQEDRNRQALKLLLDQQLAKSDHLLTTKTMMGGTDAYIGSVSLQWLANRIAFASELPLFRDKRDAQGQIVIEQETIDLVEQRSLDWRRQSQLAQYIAVHNVHKFPPVLVVMNRFWVEDERSDEWDYKGRAVRSVVDFQALDTQGRVGVLDVSEEVTLFALDGQHRLMGVRGLIELVQTGFLKAKKKSGQEEENGLIRIEDFEEQYGITRSHIQSLVSERIGIEFIPAVIAGETRQEARRRVRSVFVHVNRTAAPLTKGRLAQLDEDDGFSITARRVALEHPFLSLSDQKRVDWDAQQISERSAALTTLQTLEAMSYHYLHHNSDEQHKFRNWRPSGKRLIPLRPDDEQLNAGVDLFRRLWDRMATLPSYQKLKRIGTASLRNFSHDKTRGEGHMLFRPVGQEVLADALGTLEFKGHHDLEVLFRKLRKYDSESGFQMEPEKSIWCWVLYDPNKRRISVRGKALATRLLIHLLGEIDLLRGGDSEGDKHEKLRRDLAAARTISTGDHEGEAKDFTGKWVKPDLIKLPPTIQE